jgi:hypothetical protein
MGGRVIFTIVVGEQPTVMFEAQNTREAQELCKEHWLKMELAEAKSSGTPLWDGTTKVLARRAHAAECALYAETASKRPASEDLMLVYLVKLDGSLHDRS